MRIPGVIASAAAILLLGHQASAQTITPEPIKLPASKFPLPAAQLNQMIAANDTAALRQHAWNLWAGITADSAQTYNGQVLPIWETWLSEQEAFAGSTMALAARTTRTLRPLAIPRQFAHNARSSNRGRLRAAANGKDRILAFVKFSPELAGFVAVPHSTPAGSAQSYSYIKRADLQALNAYFNQNNTPVADRKIVDFPPAATDLKVVFKAVRATELTAVPLWTGPADSTDPGNPSSDTWKSCVAVDPTNQRTGKAKINCNGNDIEADVVPINAFYHITLTDAEAELVNQVLGLQAASRVAAGDFHIMVAMHITTKEIPNWTWQTFWWQNGQNAPGNFPGGVDNMPNSIKGAWRNYAMCIADAIVVPFNDPKGKPIVCFNPWLETQQTDGLTPTACPATPGRRSQARTIRALIYPMAGSTHRIHSSLIGSRRILSGRSTTARSERWHR